MAEAGRSRSNSNAAPTQQKSSHHHKHDKSGVNRPSNKQLFGAQGGSNAEKRQIVGQYMLGKTIGEGTFGKVKLAVHIPTGEKVGDVEVLHLKVHCSANMMCIGGGKNIRERAN